MVIGSICTALIAFIFLAYAIPQFIAAWFYKTKNLKKAYDAEWALVTGASSGERLGMPATPHPPNRRSPAADSPCRTAQALASPLPASWRGRG